MSWVSELFSSSIGKKLLMGITGLFLIVFLAVHLIVNLLTLHPDPEVFNAASHFMGHNPLIQIMQYVLALGFIIHIFMGVFLKWKNYKARPVKYGAGNKAAGASWASKNMIYTGILIFLFLIIHMKDFFVEIKFGNLGGYNSDYDLVVNLFSNPIYLVIYVVAFILLAIHLYHGFQSAFQSLGANHNKYTPFIKGFGTAYSVLIGFGFSLIAIIHFVQSL